MYGGRDPKTSNSSTPASANVYLNSAAARLPDPGATLSRMASHQDAVDRLVAACPDFAGAWAKHRERWGSESAGHYNDLGALALWVVNRMAAGDVGCFGHLFNELEALIVDSQPELRELLVVGFLEDVQNVATNRAVDPDIVLPFLGNESRKGWFELIQTWHGEAGMGWPGATRDASR